MNREAWLIKATGELRRKLFAPVSLEVPEVRVSVGWPSTRGTSAKNRTIGQCFYAHHTADEVPQVFISPVLDDPIEILGVLTHELLHAALPADTGHKGAFRKGMGHLGLTGKPTATTVGDELRPKLEALATKLGDFDHAKINWSKVPKQSTRMLKAECEVCGYTVRLTRKWLEAENPNDDYAEAGPPICPIDRVQMVADW